MRAFFALFAAAAVMCFAVGCDENMTSPTVDDDAATTATPDATTPATPMPDTTTPDTTTPGTPPPGGTPGTTPYGTAPESANP